MIPTNMRLHIPIFYSRQSKYEALVQLCACDNRQEVSKSNPSAWPIVDLAFDRNEGFEESERDPTS